MVVVEIRHGRSLDRRLELGRRIVDIRGEMPGVSKRMVLAAFTFIGGDAQRTGDRTPTNIRRDRQRRDWAEDVTVPLSSSL